MLKHVSKTNHSKISPESTPSHHATPSRFVPNMFIVPRFSYKCFFFFFKVCPPVRVEEEEGDGDNEGLHKSKSKKYAHTSLGVTSQSPLVVVLLKNVASYSI